MSQTQTSGRITAYTGADLSAKEGYIVKLTTAATVEGVARKAVVLASAATDKLLGTIALGAVAGDVVEIIPRNSHQTGKVVLGTGGATLGAYLTADANGAAVATTTSGDVLLGMALEAGSAGDLIEYMPMTDRY